MNILTINLLFSTFVFWIAAKIYLLPKLRELRPRSVLLPILLLHAFRHLGLMFLAPGGTYAGIPQQFAYPAAFGDLLAAVLALAAIPALVANAPERPASGLGLQSRGDAGSARRHRARNRLWRCAPHGTGVLDSCVLGSCLARNSLRHVHCPRQVLERSVLTSYGDRRNSR